MQCEKCGYKVDENATFCGNCGSRIENRADDRKVCKKCRNWNNERNVFCSFCGAKFEEEKVCAQCGAVLEGDFCRQCGVKSGEDIKAKEKEETNKTLNKIGSAALLFGTICSLLFVFFIGFVVKGNANGKMISQSGDIFYFFSQYTKDVKNLDLGEPSNMTVWFSKLIKTQVDLYGIVGAILSLFILLSVVIFSLIAITKSLSSQLHKAERSVDIWAIASIVSFVVGAGLFWNYTRGYADMLGGKEVNVLSKLNGSTITGIVLVGLALIVGLYCRIAANKEQVFAMNNLIKTVFAFAGILFACFLLIAAQNMTFSGVFNGVSNYSSCKGNIAIEWNFGYLFSNVVLDIVGVFSITPDLEYYTEMTAQLEMMNVLNFISQIAMILLVVFATLSVLSNVNILCGAKNKRIVWEVWTIIMAIVVLICTLLAFNCCGEMIAMLEKIGKLEVGATETFSAEPMVQIGSVFLTLILLVINGFGTFISKQMD